MAKRRVEMARTFKEEKPTARKRTRRKVTEITPEMIERRAYELWEAGAEGDQLDHWLRAEQELRAA
jgi:hypothetical protein